MASEEQAEESLGVDLRETSSDTRSERSSEDRGREIEGVTTIDRSLRNVILMCGINSTRFQVERKYCAACATVHTLDLRDHLIHYHKDKYTRSDAIPSSKPVWTFFASVH